MQRIALVITFVTCLFTQAEAASSVWKIQKGNSILYLAGTCHMLRESDYPLPPEFEKAYRAAERIVFETDIEKLQDPSTQQKLLSRAVYTDGSTLQQHLSPKTYSDLLSYCKSRRIPLETFKQFKPSMLMMSLTVMELTKEGATQRGVDQFFNELALRDKKPVEGLETIDEQLQYLLSMAEGDEDGFVSYSLNDLKNVKEQFGALADAWRTGDGDKLNEMMNRELKDKQPALFKRLISDRNRNWLPLIDGYLKTRQTELVLVGVAHLVGPDGLLETLKKKGYKIEKL